MYCSAAKKRDGGLDRGFGLIELLTVVAILAILAAILSPVITAAKRSGMGASCLGNLRNAAGALAMYADDYDGILPQHGLHSELAQYTYADEYVHRTYCQCALYPDRDPYCWLDHLQPYLRLRSLFCPADDRPLPPRFSASYEYKLDLAYDGSLHRLIKPSKVAVLWEQWAFHQPGRKSCNDERASLNVLFGDGSAKYKKLARSTTAVFGDGPDLTLLFPGVGEDRAYQGEDFID